MTTIIKYRVDGVNRKFNFGNSFKLPYLFNIIKTPSKRKLITLKLYNDKITPKTKASDKVKFELKKYDILDPKLCAVSSKFNCNIAKTIKLKANA